MPFLKVFKVGDNLDSKPRQFQICVCVLVFSSCPESVFSNILDCLLL